MSANQFEKKSEAWSARFSEPTSELVKRYTASVAFDQRLWRADIEGSLAHAAMLASQGILSAEDAADRLVNAGLEVAGVTPIAPDLKGVVVGEIEAIERELGDSHGHRLLLCRVTTGRARFPVVCGAPNTKVGVRAAFAPPGKPFSKTSRAIEPRTRCGGVSVCFAPPGRTSCWTSGSTTRRSTSPMASRRCGSSTTCT